MQIVQLSLKIGGHNTANSVLGAKFFSLSLTSVAIFWIQAWADQKMSVLFCNNFRVFGLYFCSTSERKQNLSNVCMKMGLCLHGCVCVWPGTQESPRLKSQFPCLTESRGAFHSKSPQVMQIRDLNPSLLYLQEMPQPPENRARNTLSHSNDSFIRIHFHTIS